MSDKYKAKLLNEPYFITVTVVDWIDLLTRPVYKEVILASMRYCIENKGLILHGYVIMSNHWHAIISSSESPIEDIMRDLKKYTSKQLMLTMQETHESRREWLMKKFAYAANRVKKGVNYKIWQDGYHPVHLSTNQMLDQRLEYMHRNPVEEGWVYEPEHYVYSSAIDYTGGVGKIALQMLD